MKTTFADRSRHLRQLLGVNQTEFAELFGVSRGAVGNWEVGKGISSEHLTQAAAIAGPYYHWFITGHGDAPRSKEDLNASSANTPIAAASVAPSEILPVIEAAVIATLDAVEGRSNQRFRNLVYQSVVLALLDPEGEGSHLPPETRDRILLEVGGSAFLEKAKNELPRRKT